MKNILILVSLTFVILSSCLAEEIKPEIKSVPCFIENKGQWDDDIKFAGSVPGLQLAVRTDGISFDFSKITSIGTQNRIQGNVLKMLFVNGNYFLHNEGLEPLKGYYNYFIGNDPSKWASMVKRFGSVKINGVYNGIDLLLTFDKGTPRYDFVIQPNSDPAKIKFRFEGAANVELKDNIIALSTGIGSILNGRIYAYQEFEGTRKEVTCSFRLQDGCIGFNTSDYDKSKPLIIDPLVLVSYLGGSDIEQVTDMVYTGGGSFTMVGWTLSSDFKTTAGAYDTTMSFAEDIFVSKYSLNGVDQQLVFSTFVGGSASDLSTKIAVDQDGSIYFTGNTNSKDFPVQSACQPAYSGNIDAVVCKLNKDGTKLMYSTFLGGGKYDYGMALTVTLDYYTYIAGYTASTDFPMAGASYQKTNKGLDDIFVTKLSPSGSLIKFSTYIGGTVNDRPYGIYVDKEGSVYITGETNSGDFPAVPFSNKGTLPWDRPYSAQLTGGYDAFFCKITGEGSNIANSSFFGGKSDDRGLSIFVDEDDFSIYFAGITQKEIGTPSFPTAGNPLFKTNQGGVDCFYAKMEKIKPQPSTGYRQNLLISTFFGTTGNDSLRSMFWDRNSAGVYLSGMTNALKFPDANSVNIKSNGKYDGFITKLDVSGSSIVSSALVGGSDDDCISSAGIDERGDVYFAGYSKSKDIPLIENNIQKGFAGGATDAILGKLVYGFLTMTSPSGKEVFCPGATIAVRWEQIGFSVNEKFQIQIGRKSDNWWKTLASNLQATKFDYVVKNEIPQGDGYYVRVITNSGLYSINPVPFSIGNSPVIQSTSVEPAVPNVCEGDSLKFTVSATGSNLKYQWYYNDSPVSGAKDSVLWLNTGIYNNSGNVHCVVTGSCVPDAKGNDIAIVVKPATKILWQTTDTTIKKGKNLDLKVSTKGINKTFSWYKDGSKILSATDSIFVISGANISHQGKYQCFITGDCGDTQSKIINVTVDTVTSVFEDIDSFSSVKFDFLKTQNSDLLIVRISGALEGQAVLKLVNLNGETVGEEKMYLMKNIGQETSFDFSVLPSGIYFINLYTTKESFSKKLQFIK